MASSFSCSGDARGINLRALTVINDPVAVCPAGQWQRGPSAEADAPVMWRPRLVNGSLRLSAAWPPKCDRRTGTMWRGRWTSTSRMSQCERGSPGVEYCVLRVTDATVLASGLVINATHRFNLAHSHVGQEPWRRQSGGVFFLRSTTPNHLSSCEKLRTALAGRRERNLAPHTPERRRWRRRDRFLGAAAARMDTDAADTGERETRPKSLPWQRRRGRGGRRSEPGKARCASSANGENCTHRRSRLV